MADEVEVLFDDGTIAIAPHADHCGMVWCRCGCGTLKFVMCDKEDNPIAVAGFMPTTWIDVCKEIIAECKKGRRDN